MNIKAHDLAKLLLSLPNNYVMYNDGQDTTYPDFEVVELTTLSGDVNYIDSNDLEDDLYNLIKDENGEDLIAPIILFKPI